jgi:hypothetical protein
MSHHLRVVLEHAVTFVLTSARFDHTSELPEDANAGNRFYGRDVAEFISAGLDDRGLESSFFDEDWGWQVHAVRRDGTILEISVYYNRDEDPTTPDDWWLMVRAVRKERALGIVPRLRELELDNQAIAPLEDLFRQINAPLRRLDE